jgi:hypothetical protein
MNRPESKDLKLLMMKPIDSEEKLPKLRLLREKKPELSLRMKKERLTE